MDFSEPMFSVVLPTFDRGNIVMDGHRDVRPGAGRRRPFQRTACAWPRLVPSIWRTPAIGREFLGQQKRVARLVGGRARHRAQGLRAAPSVGRDYSPGQRRARAV